MLMFCYKEALAMSTGIAAFVVTLHVAVISVVASIW